MRPYKIQAALLACGFSAVCGQQIVSAQSLVVDLEPSTTAIQAEPIAPISVKLPLNEVDAVSPLCAEPYDLLRNRLCLPVRPRNRVFDRITTKFLYNPVDAEPGWSGTGGLTTHDGFSLNVEVVTAFELPSISNKDFPTGFPAQTRDDLLDSIDTHGYQISLAWMIIHRENCESIPVLGYIIQSNTGQVCNCYGMIVPIKVFQSTQVGLVRQLAYAPFLVPPSPDYPVYPEHLIPPGVDPRLPGNRAPLPLCVRPDRSPITPDTEYILCIQGIHNIYVDDLNEHATGLKLTGAGGAMLLAAGVLVICSGGTAAPLVLAGALAGGGTSLAIKGLISTADGLVTITTKRDNGFALCCAAAVARNSVCPVSRAELLYCGYDETLELHQGQPCEQSSCCCGPNSKWSIYLRARYTYTGNGDECNPGYNEYTFEGVGGTFVGWEWSVTGTFIHTYVGDPQYAPPNNGIPQPARIGISCDSSVTFAKDAVDGEIEAWTPFFGAAGYSYYQRAFNESHVVFGPAGQIFHDCDNLSGNIKTHGLIGCNEGDITIHEFEMSIIKLTSD